MIQTTINCLGCPDLLGCLGSRRFHKGVSVGSELPSSVDSWSLRRDDLRVVPNDPAQADEDPNFPLDRLRVPER